MLIWLFTHEIVCHFCGVCRGALLTQNTEGLSVRGSCHYADSAGILDGLLSTARYHEQSDSRVPVMSAATSWADGWRCVPGESVAWCYEACILPSSLLTLFTASCMKCHSEL